MVCGGEGMITIKNTQRKIKISVSQIKKNLEKMLDVAGYPDFDIGIWFTTDKTIRAYNKKYRKKANKHIKFGTINIFKKHKRTC